MKLWEFKSVFIPVPVFMKILSISEVMIKKSIALMPAPGKKYGNSKQKEIFIQIRVCRKGFSISAVMTANFTVWMQEGE